MDSKNYITNKLLGRSDDDVEKALVEFSKIKIKEFLDGIKMIPYRCGECYDCEGGGDCHFDKEIIDPKYLESFLNNIK